jgi:hypothetical protein
MGQWHQRHRPATSDDGDHWQLCATPSGAEGLDFRGIQSFDANTAIVMSSGKGGLSRLYKTTDACQTWKLVFTNPDEDGFWDAVRFSKPWSTRLPQTSGVLIGDPVAGTFCVFLTSDSGETWRRWGRGGFGWKGDCRERKPKASKDEALFAASNESVFHFFSTNFLFVTGGQSGARLVYSDLHDFDGPPCWITFSSVRLPLARASSSAGACAVAAKNNTYFPLSLMVVGGDYTKPDESFGNAVFLSSKDGPHVPLSSYFTVTTPMNPPHGYRSSGAYDASPTLGSQSAITAPTFPPTMASTGLPSDPPLLKPLTLTKTGTLSPFPSWLAPKAVSANYGPKSSNPNESCCCNSATKRAVWTVN